MSKHIEMLINALETSPGVQKDKLNVLTNLYLIKINALNGYDSDIRAAEKYCDAIKHIVTPTLIEDPSMVRVEKQPDLNCQINGQPMKFKIDTGASTSVIDSKNIIWDLAPEIIHSLNMAYDTHTIVNKDGGYMTYDSMIQADAAFINLQFGQVTSFDMVIHRKGQADDSVDVVEESEPDILVPMHGPFDVIGISNPKKSNGERDGLRPVVSLPIEGAGFAAGSQQPFSLKSRGKMARRGLMGLNELTAAKMSILFDARDTRIIDPAQIDNIVAQMKTVFGM